MKQAIRDSLDSIQKKADDLSAKLSDPKLTSDINQLTKLNKEYSEIKDVVENWNRYQELEASIKDLNTLIKDEEMKSLALEEKDQNEKELEKIEAEIMIQLLPKDKDDERNSFVELRAGAGGDEAAIFVGDLYRMYGRFAERNKWKVEKIKEIPSGTGGFKEIVIKVIGTDTYGNLKFESGVHRVQRVPQTETQGRVHTSAATVIVLPEAEEFDVDLNMQDVRIERTTSTGPGGQSVNTTYSAIKLHHEPTGIIVSCQDQKSQHKNLDKALKVLRSRLYELEMKKREEADSAKRNSMVSSGDRSAKIRTYNYPQGRVTDHRINLTLYDLQNIVNGDIDKLVEELKIVQDSELIKNEEI